MNQRYGKPSQHPYTLAEPINKRHLILLPKLAEPADLQTLKLDAFEAEAKGNWQDARQLWRRVLAVSYDAQAFDALDRIALRLASLGDIARGAVTTASGTRSTAPEIAQTEPIAKPKPAVPTFEFEVVTVNAQGKIQERRKGQAEYRREDLGKGISLDLVMIPGGSFLMGSPDTEAERDEDESPQHQVKIQPFLMGKYAVTQAQWKAVAALPKADRDLEPDPSKFKGANRPVEKSFLA